jgi:L-alanine-DL-glutamate epimerase-like enolase superfamily enzyme
MDLRQGCETDEGTVGWGNYTDWDDAPWRDDLMTHLFEINNGYLKVPERPSLGSDLVESELKKHA